MKNPQFKVEEGVPIGWITAVLYKVASWATFPRRYFMGDHLLVDLSEANAVSEAVRRARKSDTFLAVCFILDLASVFLIAWSRNLGVWLAAPYLSWRIADVTFTALHATLFGEFLLPMQRMVNLAPARVVTLGLLSYFELVLCFGGIYLCWPDLIRAEERDFLTPFHLSFITQLTIGYGDVSPRGFLRPVTWMQGMCSILLLVFLIDKYLGELRRPKP
jgi:hypothetical protein